MNVSPAIETDQPVPAPPHSRVVTEPIDAAALLESVRSPAAGAAVLFVGSVREFTEEAGGVHQTQALTYEAYVPMAERQMQSILKDAISRHGLTAAAAEHRIGTLELGELAVVVAVSSPHREAAFNAGREVLEQIKSAVPIWKKDHAASGDSHWVAGQGASR